MIALDMQKCEITHSQLGFASDTDSSENLRRIVRRLPTHMRPGWVDIAYDINVKADREPKFSDLVCFVNKMSQTASSMFATDIVRDNQSRSSGQDTHVQSDSFVM